MTGYPFAEVLVNFVPYEEGGRRLPPHLNAQGYRPHFRIRNDHDLLGVEFVNGPDGPVKPGRPTYSTVRFIYFPGVSYEKMAVGVEFEIIEGPKKVGTGKVTRR